jgi:hypothetical protein
MILLLFGYGCYPLLINTCRICCAPRNICFRNRIISRTPQEREVCLKDTLVTVVFYLFSNDKLVHYLTPQDAMFQL